MPRDPNNHKHQSLTIKLEKADIAALDRFVELAGLRGRGHALRLMAGPYLEATKTAMETKSARSAFGTMTKQMMKMNKMVKGVAKTESETGQTTLLDGLDLQVQHAT